MRSPSERNAERLVWEPCEGVPESYGRSTRGSMWADMVRGFLDRGNGCEASSASSCIEAGKIAGRLRSAVLSMGLSDSVRINQRDRRVYMTRLRG